MRDEPERGLWKHEGVCEEEEVIDSWQGYPLTATRLAR